MTLREEVIELSNMDEGINLRKAALVGATALAIGSSAFGAKAPQMTQPSTQAVRQVENTFKNNSKTAYALINGSQSVDDLKLSDSIKEEIKQILKGNYSNQIKQSRIVSRLGSLNEEVAL